MVIQQIETRPEVVGLHEYQRIKTKLDVGDMVLSYSNALTECRTASGHTLGLDGLQNIVRQIDPTEPACLLERVVARIVGDHADNLSDHGATLLLCRANDTSVTWRDNLLALFRLLRPVSDRTTIRQLTLRCRPLRGLSNRSLLPLIIVHPACYTTSTT